jgi:hypothetical protein
VNDFDIADLRDGRQETLSQPLTRHGKAGPHSHSEGALRGLPAEGVGRDIGSAAGEGFPLHFGDPAPFMNIWLHGTRIVAVSGPMLNHGAGGA